MKKRYKNKKNYLVILSVAILFLVLCLSIGFSAFGQNLNIADIAGEVRPQADIRVTNIVGSDATHSGTFIAEDYNISRILTSFSLPQENSTVTYKIEVTNIGNVEEGILKFTGLPDNLEMSLQDYELKTKICVDGECSLGIKKEFYITFKYKANSYDASNTNFEFTLDFDFEPFYKVTYSDFTIATDNLPQEVMAGDTLKVTFNSSISQNNLKIFMANQKITDFTFEGNVLQVENVSGDVRIVYKSSDNFFYAFMEEQSLGTDKDIDFTSSNITTGVYLHEETKDDPYPVYYYRGSVTDNNVIFAGYCWKIVRTTETGGLKLIYNDKISNKVKENNKIIKGSCLSTHEYLGSEAFNNKINVDGVDYVSPSQTGYMYGDVKIIEKVAPSYLKDTGNPRVLEVGTVFGNDVTYDKGTGEYTLVDTITITDLNDLEDDIRGGSSYGGIGHHYTCLSNKSSCSKVYYIYFDDYGNDHDTNAEGLFGMALDDGLDVKATLDRILFKSSNTNSSYAKTYLDQFFEGTGYDFERSEGEALKNYVNDLDDVQWCNDRTIAGYHGWDLNNDNHSQDNKYLHFKAFGRLIGDGDIQVVTRPDITCDDVNDTFTVSSANGNGKLTYPIGLLTADEAVLAGVLEKENSNSYLNIRAGKNQFLMTPYYISDDHVRMFAISSEGKLSSGYASTSYAIRPAIALKPIYHFASGDGTENNPYILEK